MLSAGVASLEKRDFDAFSSSMSAVVQELYAGLPAALSSERPARVLGANPEAFVLSCGGLPSEHQRTHGIRPSSSPERLDPPGKTSLSVGDNEGQNGGGGTATPGSVSSPPREGADILEEEEEEEEEDSETPGPLRTQENGEPRSNLPYAETPTSLQNLDEAKEPPVAENASRSEEETRGRTVNGDGALSSARDAFPNSGDGFLLYGGEDVKTFSDNCARRDEENNACFTLENRTTADDTDSPFGIAPWDETADVVEVVCETDESDGETLEIGFLEEWASETKMEESVSPAASCADLYGGDGEQQTDHSYSRRDEKDAEMHNGTAVRRDDGDETDENGVSLVAAANSGALENGVSPLHADSSDCDLNSGEGGFPPMIRERNRRIRDERKLPSASQNGGSSQSRHGAEVAATKDDTAEARSKGRGVRDPCLSDLCSALEERCVVSEIEKDPKVSTKMDATSVEMKDIFAPNGAIVELDKDGLSKAVVKEGGPICQVETQLFANDFTQTLLHRAQEVRISKEEQLEDLTQTLLHTAQEVCNSEEAQIEDLTKTLLHTAQEVCHSEEQQVDEVTQSLLHTAQQIFNSEEQQVEEITPTLPHTAQAICIPEEQQVDDITQTLLHTAQETFISGEQQVEDITQPLLHTAQEICNSEEQQVEDLTQTLLHTPQEICHSEEPQVEDVTQTLLHTAQEICNSEEQQAEDISEEQQVEDLTQTLHHTAQEVCHPEEQQVEDVTQTLLHIAQEICNSEEQQVEDLTQTLLHTAQEVCHSEEQQGEDLTQTLLHTAQEVCHSEEQQVEDLTQTLLHTAQEVCHSEEQQVEDVTQTLLHTAQEVCHSEEQQVEDLTQTLLHTAQEICHSEEQQVEDLTQTLLHTAQEVYNSEEQQVEDLTQTLLHTAQEIRHSEEQQVEDLTQTLLHTAQEVCHSEEPQVEDLTQALLHTAQEVYNSEEQQVEDLTETLLRTPQEICNSEEPEVEDLTQTLLHTPQEICNSEEPEVEDLTQTLLHTAQEVCHSEEQQVEDLTQTLLHTPQEVCHSEEQQVEDLTQTLLHTPQEVCHSEEQQVEDLTQTLLHTPQEIRHSEEPQVEDVTQTLLHTPQEICHSEEQQVEDISEEQQVEDVTQTLLNTPQDICNSEEQQVDDLTQTLLHTAQEICHSDEQQIEDLTQTLLHTPEEISISEEQQVEDVTQTLLHTAQEICHSEEPQVEDLTQSLLHRAQEICHSKEQQVQDITQTLLHTAQEISMSEEQQVEDLTQTLLRTPEESQISASEEQQVKGVTQTLLHAAQETQIRISEDQQVEDVTQTLLHPPEETQISTSEEQLVEDVTQTLLHTPEETELCISVAQQVEDVTQTLLRTPEETQNGVPEEQQVDDVTQTAAILGEETQTINGSRCVIGDEERTTKAAKTKRPSKRRRTLEIGRHLCGVSFPTAVKPAQRRPSSGSVVPNTENGGLTRPKRPKALIEAEIPRSGNFRSPAPNFCATVAPSQCAYAIPCGKRLRILRTCPEKSSLTVAAPRLVRKRPPPSDFGPQLLSPAQFPVAKNARVTIWDRAPKLDVFKPSGRAKEAAILRKMSLLADKLLAPARNRQTSTPLSAPEKYGHFGNKMVPKLFAGTKLRWPWIDADGGSDGVFEKFSSPSFWIYSLESAAMFAFELSGKTPFAASSSYHAKMASVSSESLQSVAYGSAWREPHARPPSEWSFSFLVSQNAAGAAPVLSLPPPSGPDATKDGSYAVARRASGLQTVLALFFPGCWRLLARKRRPAVKFPSVRRLAFLRFAGASKDSSAQLFATSRSAFGGELPSWDRLDPSSEISPFRSPRGADWTPATLPTPQGAFALHNRWELAFSASFPKYLPIPETSRSSRLALSPPEFSARPSDEPDAPVPAAFPESDASPREDGESEKKPKKVSQIRIRKTVPKPDPNLTPMGLPRPKRLKKTEFSLEEIYTNKNYKSPPATRSLETIFEEPKERNGSLIAVSHQKRKRILEFQDFTAPRKRKARSRVKVTGAGGFTRAQKAASEGRELDGLLIQRLTDLETFLAAQEEMADAPGS